MYPRGIFLPCLGKENKPLHKAWKSRSFGDFEVVSHTIHSITQSLDIIRKDQWKIITGTRTDMCDDILRDMLIIYMENGEWNFVNIYKKKWRSRHEAVKAALIKISVRDNKKWCRAKWSIGSSCNKNVNNLKRGEVEKAK